MLELKRGRKVAKFVKFGKQLSHIYRLIEHLLTAALVRKKEEEDIYIAHAVFHTSIKEKLFEIGCFAAWPCPRPAVA